MTTNLLMVQSWIPSRAAISLNGPSWSISTEFAFYLMFPLLISDFARTWHVKLVGAIVLSFLIVVACFALGIDWGHGAFPVIVGFPLTRLFEFVLGMCAALLWRRLPALHIGPVYGTALELAALGLVVLASHLAVRVPNPGSAPSAWLAICALPSVPAALLIVAMAMNRGLISRALSFPAAVFLGGDFLFRLSAARPHRLRRCLPAATDVAGADVRRLRCDVARPSRRRLVFRRTAGARRAHFGSLATSCS